jgi:hypothetical protein
MQTQTVVSLPSPPTVAVISVDLVAASYRSDTFPTDWSRERRVSGVERYQRWLTLKQLAPKLPLAPTAEIDLFWHLHMLSPVAYFKDCKRLFGFILDHDGGFGKEAEELPVLQNVFIDTARRYEQAFGEAYRDDGQAIEAAMTNCWHDCDNRCWHACSNLSNEAAL